MKEGLSTPIRLIYLSLTRQCPFPAAFSGRTLLDRESSFRAKKVFFSTGSSGYASQGASHEPLHTYLSLLVRPGCQRAGVPHEGDRVVGKKLYVVMSYSVSNADLEAMFAPFGTVQSAQVIEDRDTGRSKGFAFVEMGTDQEAEAAIAGLSGKEHDGRT